MVALLTQCKPDSKACAKATEDSIDCTGGSPDFITFGLVSILPPCRVSTAGGSELGFILALLMLPCISGPVPWGEFSTLHS